MGLNYSFRFYLLSANIEKALISLTARADKESSAYLVNAVPYGSAGEIAFLSRDDKFPKLKIGVRGLELGIVSRRNNHYCLGLLLPKDSWTLAFANTYPKTQEDSVDKLAIGCIYLTVLIGELFAELSLTAATSDMSKLFLDSRLVQQEMLDLQKDMGAFVCLFDTEIDEHRVLGKHQVLTLNYDDYYIDEHLVETKHEFIELEDIDEKVKDIVKQS